MSNTVPIEVHALEPGLTIDATRSNEWCQHFIYAIRQPKVDVSILAAQGVKSRLIGFDNTAHSSKKIVLVPGDLDSRCFACAEEVEHV